MPIQTGDKLQQKHMHTANNGYNRFTSISGHATIIDNKGTCIHSRLFGVFETKLGGAAFHMDINKGAKRPGDNANTGHVGWQQM